MLKELELAPADKNALIKICGICKAPKVETEHDVGWDIDDKGEERQHIERCTTCGAWRLSTTYYPFNGKPDNFHGTWHRREDDPWTDYPV